MKALNSKNKWPQVHYAALDAAVLLDLLDKLAAAAPPHRQPLSAPAPAAESAPGANMRDEACAASASDGAEGCTQSAERRKENMVGDASCMQPGGRTAAKSATGREATRCRPCGLPEGQDDGEMGSLAGAISASHPMERRAASGLIGSMATAGPASKLREGEDGGRADCSQGPHSLADGCAASHPTDVRVGLGGEGAGSCEAAEGLAGRLVAMQLANTADGVQGIVEMPSRAGLERLSASSNRMDAAGSGAVERAGDASAAGALRPTGRQSASSSAEVVDQLVSDEGVLDHSSTPASDHGVLPDGCKFSPTPSM